MVFNWFKGLFCVFLGFGVTTGCLAAKSAMAHASANSTFETKTLSVHGCWAFCGTSHLQHIDLELDLLSIHHLLPGGGSPPSNIDVSNSTPSLHQSIHQEEMGNP